MKIYYKILGCKMNLLEGERIAKELSKHGFISIQDDADANYIIVNTCAVTGQAEKKSRQAIRSLISKNPNTDILAFGCGTKASPEVFESIKGVRCFRDWQEVAEYLKAISNKPVSSKQKFEHFRTRAYIEVQNGCDNYCTY
jgi:threonylcarbamoyladenosine tRNA methylthiotransferase MtaB